MKLKANEMPKTTPVDKVAKRAANPEFVPQLQG
jgi:hypothetical protein